MKWLVWRAHQRFAGGELTGKVVARELSAYAVVASR